MMHSDIVKPQLVRSSHAPQSQEHAYGKEYIFFPIYHHKSNAATDVNAVTTWQACIPPAAVKLCFLRSTCL